MECRKIIHVDMDAFYAAVEQKKNPALKGKPVIVGGDPDRRGVVSTCSYEARKYGVKSAMPSKTAVKLCPHGIFLYPDFTAYREASREIIQIFHEYTDLVEPLSLDEAFLDVTENKKNIPYATAIAREIRKRIFTETGLTASAGVSYNKFLAKSASEINKPDGLAIIRPEEAENFLESLPIGKFFGIGKATEKKMFSLGIANGADLKEKSLEVLVKHFGKAGHFYYHIVRGIDNRKVVSERVCKSVGKETTLDEDIDSIDGMHSILENLGLLVENNLKRKEIRGKTVTLKVKYADFESATRSITLNSFVNDSDTICNYAKNLLNETRAGEKKVRLLGISMSNLDNDDSCLQDFQLTLPFKT
jgi:DNA polymerase-4